MGRLSRIQRLARRVGWLDRYRRMIAIAIAVAMSVLMISELRDALGADWPELHATLLGVMLGAILWCLTEIALAWLTALWETECHRLMRQGELPAARVVIRK
ncbi:MAG: hypothetical protein WKG01_39530 [Kofleriaceae bacterium]